MTKVTLTEMLEARERRQTLQQELLKKYSLPLVCLNMNIAGEYKNSGLIRYAFRAGVKSITAAFGEPVYRQTTSEVTGCEAVFVYDKPAEALKSAAICIEDANAVGRLYDIDIIDTDGHKLSRQDSRKCIVCGGPVLFCSRSRAHSLEEIYKATNRLLTEFVCSDIADKAVNALLREARLTPKPGLVDSANNGAHKDMDLTLLEKSAESLRPYFYKAAGFGIRYKVSELIEDNTENSGAFAEIEELRSYGINAEKDMLKATGSINTHKGAIYTLGLLCAGAAEAIAEGTDCVSASLPYAENIFITTVYNTASGLAVLLDSDHRQDLHSHSHGNAVRSRYCKGSYFPAMQPQTENAMLAAGTARSDICNGGRLLNNGTADINITGLASEPISGPVDEAKSGFPHISAAATALISGTDPIEVLLRLITETTDTNLLWRGGPEGLIFAKKQSAGILNHVTGLRADYDEVYCHQVLIEMTSAFDLECIRRNLSPGGCADLLAAAFLMQSLS